MKTKQSVVYENAGQLIADRAMNQSRRNGRIDAAGKTENNFIFSNLMTNFFNGFLSEVAHDPVGSGLADLKNKGLKDFTALLGMRNFLFPRQPYRRWGKSESSTSV